MSGYIPAGIPPEWQNVLFECESCTERPYQVERPRGWKTSPGGFPARTRTLPRGQASQGRGDIRNEARHCTESAACTREQTFPGY